MAEKRNVLITGCNSGIGKSLLDTFSPDEYRIFATVRKSNYDAFKSLLAEQKRDILPYALDVTDLENGTAVMEDIHNRFGHLDILINNAGIAYRTVVEEMAPEDESLQMTTNYFGPMHLIRLGLPNMRRRRKGHIINISSVGGMMAMPTMSAYSASKFALEGASESLWYEVRPFKIHVSLIRPGFINSNSFRKVRFGKYSHPEQSDSSYYNHYKHMAGFIEKLMTRTPCTPESVARTIYRTTKMKNPPLRVAGTPDARFFSFLRRTLPRRFYHWVLYRSLPGIKLWEGESRK